MDPIPGQYLQVFELDAAHPGMERTGGSRTYSRPSPRDGSDAGSDGIDPCGRRCFTEADSRPCP